MVDEHSFFTFQHFLTIMYKDYSKIIVWMEYIHVVNSSALKHTYFDFLYVINQNKNGKKCVPDIIVPGKKNIWWSGQSASSNVFLPGTIIITTSLKILSLSLRNSKTTPSYLIEDPLFGFRGRKERTRGDNLC